MNTNTKITIAVVAGLSVGASIGYFVAEKRLKTKYEAMAEDEINVMREHYQMQNLDKFSASARARERKPVPTEEELNKAYSDSILQQKLAPSEETIEKVREIINYSAYAERKEPEEVKTPNDPRPAPVDVASPQYLPEDEGINKPYIITVDMYMANDEAYDQISLTYYSGDKVLVNDADAIVDDVDQAVGASNLDKFGEESGDPYTVYVRNDKRQADFEIVLDDRRFGVDILGMVDLEEQLVREPKPRPRKFRDT